MRFKASLPTTLATIASLFAVVAHCQIQLINFPTVPSLSSTCLSVLNQAVQCDPSLKDIGDRLGGEPVQGTPTYMSSDDLNALCTAQCGAGLSAWERRIAGACGTTLYSREDGSQYALSSIAEGFVEIYNTLCLKNSYCNDVLGKLLGINPDNQVATGTPGSTAYCDDCFLSLISTQLAMPLASNTDQAKVFTSVTSSCSKTGWTLSPPPSGTIFTQLPTTTPAAPSCTGTQYTIAGLDTCVSVSQSQGISTDDLMSYNNLSSLCQYFPKAGTQLCIPAARKCKAYTVQSTDTCNSLQTQFKMSYAQLMAWNPSLGARCSNIAQYVGFVICVSNPGGTWVNPSPSATPPTTTVPPLWTYTLPDMSSYPNATYVPTSNPAPYGNQTRLDCETYVTAPIMTDYTGNGTTSFACADVATQFGIALADFVSWNPSLSASGGCTMANYTQYCVQLTEVVASDMTDACVQRDMASAGYGCARFAADHGLDWYQFLQWNPAVGSNCEKFKVGTQYCVAVSHYKQPGIVSICNKFVSPNKTDYFDQPCQLLEAAYGVSHARFVAWNPAVNDNCTGLFPGYDYCVSIPNYKPTYTTPTPKVLMTGMEAAATGNVTSSGSGITPETTLATSSAASGDAPGSPLSVAADTPSLETPRASLASPGMTTA